MTMKTGFRSIRLAVLGLLLVSAMINVSEAFSLTPPHKSREATSSTSAIGYTIQIPEFVVRLPKGGTWYDVANPTARRIVYDDAPSKFMFATVGSDWPELSDNSEKEEASSEPTPKQPRHPWSRFNLLRRARNLIRRVL